MLAALCVAILAALGGSASVGRSAVAPVGQDFVVTAGDLTFILKQIKIAEHHAATATASDQCGTLVGPGPNQIPDRLTPYGLRTVDGSCNNLFPAREKFATADQPFPRLATANFRDAEGRPANFFGPGDPGSASSSYKQKLAGNLVYDSQPRMISNLIVDQTATNPAAIAAAGFPVRSQNNPGLKPCTTDPNPTAVPPVDGVPAGCVPSGQTLFIPNVTTDVGLSPPYNSLFTFFGQFFDHGVDQTVKSGATVFVPLHADDPLVTSGKAKPGQQFMVLTRAQNQPGPDGILGTADDIQDANNTDTPWVDQSQTYTSHPSHQLFLREYTHTGTGRPLATGMLLGGLPAGQTYSGSPDGQAGISTWAAVKAQASSELGLWLQDKDVTNIPMMAVDPYGNYIPGPARGLPQYVTKDAGGNVVLVEGDRAANGGKGVEVPSNVVYFDTPFLTDIAHNADPSPVDTDNNPSTPPVAPVPDADNTPSADFANQPSGTYDDELLNAHFACGDGRCNENIALSTIHQIFHSEHDRLVTYIKGVLAANPSLLAAYQNVAPTAGDPKPFTYGERLFQAARFVTEMEYQHLVFEEFARKLVPAIKPFHVYSPDINAAIPAEFAHAVYRFGHSMLDNDVARNVVNDANPAAKRIDTSLPLLNAFLNPPQYFNGDPSQTTAATVDTSPGHRVLTPAQAAGSIVMGSSDQIGNELDEFVTETLRNNLLGLPLDLATLNMARARSEGVPPLNDVRRQIFAATNDGAMAPYASWAEYGQHLKHPESLINFVAAYGLHPSITSETTLAGKRAAAKAIVDPGPTPNACVNPGDPAGCTPTDASDFMFSTGSWAGRETGLNQVDLWVGGLAEVTNINGGLLGSTFNYVFQGTLENLQDGDRFYYLNRTPGLNLRAQLEGNSFSELIQRNTDGTDTLKADAFASADCKFQISRLTSPADPSNPTNITDVPYLTGAGSVNDDPLTDCNENALLVNLPDPNVPAGRWKYRQINSIDPSGINGQSVYNGTPNSDSIMGGLDNDTFWGGAGRDWIEGGGGDDIALGGDGNDILTDLDGADTQKGGPGNDAIDAGPGNDIPMGGDGQDFILGGAGDNETFAGEGNDFINAGQGADAVFGDGGNDWIQGGLGQDLLQGDHGAAFFDDPGELAPGNDIFVGQPGENDYDAEGGDDVMVQNPAIDRNAGAGGFDWAIHQYDTVPGVGANDDMMINNNLGGLPIQVIVNRDRWQETEADSGSKFDDIIKGTDGVLATPRLIGGGGFTGCDAIDQAGLNRINGLAALLPPVSAWVGQAADVAAISATGFCPLTGPVWGEGDILLGGAGSDTFTGRAGDDIIDGDSELVVHIQVNDGSGNELGRTDLMEHQPTSGTFGPGTAGMNLQQAVFAGLVNPGNLTMVRDIIKPANAGAIDTAVFAGPRAAFTIVKNANGSTTVTDTTGVEGTDTLWNVEQAQFTDQTVGLVAGPAPALTSAQAATGLTFTGRVLLSTSAPKSVTVTNSGTTPATLTLGITGDFAVASDTCVGSPLAAGASCTVNVTYTPTVAGIRTGTLSVTPFGGSAVTIALTGDALAAVPAPAVSLSAPLSFGSQNVSVASTAQTVTVTNSGNANLVINAGGASIGGANAGDFSKSADTCSGTTVAAGSNCTVSIRFTPGAAGARTASLSIASNAAGSNSVALSGTGVVPVVPTTITLSATALGLGGRRFAVGNTSTAVVTITNARRGNPLQISPAIQIGPGANPQMTGANASEFFVQSTTCNATIAPRGSCTITFAFRPTSSGSKAASFKFSWNGVASPTTIALTGSAR